MTSQAPLHLERRRLIGNRHLIDAPMARRTAHPFIYMNAVIEISVIRKVVHSDPLDWFAGTKTGANRLEIRAIRPDLLMAVHAGLC